MEGLRALIDSKRALEHVAASGWHRQKKDAACVQIVGKRRKPNPSSRFTWYDAAAIAKHNELLNQIKIIMTPNGTRPSSTAIDDRLGALAKKTNDWLIDREMQVLGCSGQYADCVANYDRSCGWLGADGGCRLRRR